MKRLIKVVILLLTLAQGNASHAQIFEQPLDPLRLSPGISSFTFTPDTGYIVSNSFSNNLSGLSGGHNLTKLTRNASVVWSKDYYIPGIRSLTCEATYWPNRNGYLLATSIIDTVQSRHVAFADTAGNIQWSFRYGPTGDVNLINMNSGRCFARPYTNDDFILAGGTTFHATTQEKNDFYVARINANGGVVWGRSVCFSCLGEFDVTVQQVTITSSGTILIYGGYQDYRTLFNVNDGFYITAMDGAGNILWTKTYTTSGFTERETAYDIVERADGHLLVCGDVDVFSTKEGLIMEMDNNGNILSESRVKVASLQHQESARRILPLNNGHVVVAISTTNLVNGAASGQSNILSEINLSTNQSVWSNNYEEEAFVGFQTPTCDLKKSYDNGYCYLLNTNPGGFSQLYPILVQTDVNGRSGCEVPLPLQVISVTNIAANNLTVQTLPFSNRTAIPFEDSLFTGLVVDNEALNLGPDTTLPCDVNFSLNLNASLTNYTFLWNTGATTSGITVTTPGVYRVVATKNGACIQQTDTIRINQGGLLQYKLKHPVLHYAQDSHIP